MRAIVLFALSATVLMASLSGQSPTSTAKTRVAKFIVESPAFREGEAIPTEYAEPPGGNVSPPLAWRNLPSATRELAVVFEDLDYLLLDRPNTHWMLYKIPATAKGLPANIPAGARVTVSGFTALQGLTAFTFRSSGPALPPRYWGPKPYSGPHRYRFKVYAFDVPLQLDAGSSILRLLSAMEGKIIGEGELVGLFPRPGETTTRRSEPSPPAPVPSSSRLTTPRIHTMTNRAFLGSFPTSPQERNLVLQQLDVLIKTEQQILECNYGTSETGFVSFVFWYKAPPARIREVLTSLPGDTHPFWLLGVRALDNCPATRERARQVRLDGLLSR